MASNTAAWIMAPKAKPLEIKPAPMGVPGQSQILVKNHAVSINPIDGKLQSMALYPLSYPTILGQDVAGEVVAVGPGVTRFKPGARVLGNAAGFTTKRDEEKGFQAYTVLETNLTSEIPDNISYERAVVLPVCLSTASACLFSPDFLNLRLPSHPALENTGETVLVWGGASSVGCNAIQLAVAAGYSVVATASPKNFDLVKRLGASAVFDYRNPTVVPDILAAIGGSHCVGAVDAVGSEAWAPTAEVVRRANGVKFVATTIPRFPEFEGVTMKQAQSLSIRGNHVGKAVYESFLPKALSGGSFVPAPEPLVAGTGLESVQGAMDLLAEGVSAQKIVVTL
ncbi:zinc-binding oxidoreductase CipB [Xylariaceae sp. FL0016]|nr:zinc-binding oxidoreductase CipB [Xylariaceae sp. FL0016]